MPQIRVVNPELKNALLLGTGVALDEIIAEHPRDMWIQLMGEDSAGRYFAGNAPKRWFTSPERQVLVASRPGQKTEFNVSPIYAHQVKSMNLIKGKLKTSEKNEGIIYRAKETSSSSIHSRSSGTRGRRVYLSTPTLFFRVGHQRALNAF